MSNKTVDKKEKNLCTVNCKECRWLETSENSYIFKNSLVSWVCNKRGAFLGFVNPAAPKLRDITHDWCKINNLTK